MRTLARLQPSRHDLVQFVEYFVGGSAYFWSGYGVFALCYSGLGWHWFPAKMIADLIGWSLNYLFQRYWAFASSQLKRQEGQTVGRYALVTALNLALDYLIIWALKRAGISPYLGFFISAGFFIVWNYVWYRFWVFYVKQRHVSKEVA